jgi:hypothetical protein
MAAKKAVGSKQRCSASSKVAMVAPVPAKPKEKPDMVEVLQQLGNDRPYFVISTKADSWVVHFSGDSKPSMIVLVGGKWVIA